MGGELSTSAVKTFLTIVGDRLQNPASLVLLGGSGLSLLGNQRPTLDLDFNGEESESGEFRRLLEQVAAEMHVEIEAVPLHRFIPLPQGADGRHVPIEAFGKLMVFVFDPYSIALSKLDRGFDSDLEDVAFLLRQEWIDAETLETMIDDATMLAAAFDLNPDEMRVRLDLALQTARRN